MSPEKREMEQTASPYSCLMQTSDFYFCVITVMGFAAPLEAGNLKESARKTLIKHPRFSSLLVFKHKDKYQMSWKPTAVDLDDHIFTVDVSPELESGDRFVEDFISTITKTPMDLSKPLWEIHVINVRTTQAASTAVLRLHHSLGDGVSLMSIVLACSRKISDPESLPALPSTARRAPRRAKKGVALLSLIWSMILTLYYTALDLIVITATMIWYRDSENPIKGKTGKEDSPKRYVHRVYNMEDIKLIKNSMHMTVNDVVFGVTEAALSSYVLRKYGDLENGVKNRRIRGLLAFNMRPSATIEDMSEVMEGGRKLDLNSWGNKVGFMLIPLKLRLESNPVSYLRSAKAIMDRKKLSLQPHAGYYFVKLLMLLLGMKTTSRILRRTFGHLSFGVSNMVGPREEISLFDYPLTYLAPTVTGIHGSLVIHFQSYANKLIVFIAAEEKVFPDPYELFVDLNNAILKIKDAVLKKNSVDDSRY